MEDYDSKLKSYKDVSIFYKDNELYKRDVARYEFYLVQFKLLKEIKYKNMLHALDKILHVIVD